MEEQHKKVLFKGEFNLRSSRLFIQWAAIIFLVLITGIFFLELIKGILEQGVIRETLKEHVKAVLGIPLSALTAFVLVIVFEKLCREYRI